ncbi:unnamed protein product, partial [Mycena citricolor]
TMAWNATGVLKYCDDAKTIAEAERLFREARRITAPGSGHDLGENRTALEPICAYIASQRLNNTHVTIDAARIASCQALGPFKKLLARVEKALESTETKATSAESPTFAKIRIEHYQKTPLRMLGYMDKIMGLLVESFAEKYSETEMVCATFAWVCNQTGDKEQAVSLDAFEAKYRVRRGKMKTVTKDIDEVCDKHMAEAVRSAYQAVLESTRAISLSPRKSPRKHTQPQTPSRHEQIFGTPRKRKAAEAPSDSEPEDTSASPTRQSKRLKAAGLITLESIKRMQSTPSSPSKTRQSPSKSALRTPSATAAAPGTPSRPSKSVQMVSIAEASSSDDDEEDELPRATRRRVRPVFRDQLQWGLCDPRLQIPNAKLGGGIKGRPARRSLVFPDLRRKDGDMDVDSD